MDIFVGPENNARGDDDTFSPWSGRYDTMGADIVEVAFILLSRVTMSMKERRRTLRESKEKIGNDLRIRAEEIRDQFRSSPTVEMRQKVSFYLGINFTCFLILLLCKYPSQLKFFYLISYPALVAYRVLEYGSKGWHYFTLDLCYFANWITLAYLFFLPGNDRLLRAAFTLTHGPVVWAVVQWRNSLVFHSLDKITSLFIHVLPCLTLYVVRWFDAVGEVVEDTYSVQKTVKDTIGLYAIWQTAYWCIVHIMNKEKIEAGKRVTSFSYIFAEAQTRKSSRLYRILTFFGAKNADKVFSLLQFLHALITSFPVFLYWQNFWIHTSFLLFIINVAIWNGATYYVDVFSRSYATRFAKVTQQVYSSSGTPLFDSS